MIKSLTALRGVFILFIFFHHCLDLYPGGGSMAVTFFFVLGGFSMTLGYKDKVNRPDFSYRHYITKRCMKFYPLHWMCLLAVLPLVGLPLGIRKGLFFIANAGLMQTLLPIKSLYFSYNSVSWYLADTLFFAVLFPPLLRFIIRAPQRNRILFLSSAIILYLIVAVLLPQQHYHAFLYISPFFRIVDFIIGIYLALFFTKIRHKPLNLSMLWKDTTGLIITFVLILLLVAESCILGKIIRLIAAFYWPLVTLIILLASLSDSVGGGGILWTNKFLQRLGQLSFIIFLTHQLVLRYITEVFIMLEFNNDVLYIIVTLLLTLAVSVIMERYFLNPISKWLTKITQPSMTAR